MTKTRIGLIMWIVGTLIGVVGAVAISTYGYGAAAVGCAGLFVCVRGVAMLVEDD